MIRAVQCLQRVALALLMLVAMTAGAQDPQANAAQKAARDFMAMTDRGDAAGSWAKAGAQFRRALSAQAWSDALKRARPPLGDMIRRTLEKSEFTRSAPNMPDGDYAVLVFRSSFVKKSEALERVTLERESDGDWHVIGYFIQ